MMSQQKNLEIGWAQYLIIKKSIELIFNTLFVQLHCIWSEQASIDLELGFTD